MAYKGSSILLTLGHHQDTQWIVDRLHNEIFPLMQQSAKLTIKVPSTTPAMVALLGRKHRFSSNTTLSWDSDDPFTQEWSAAYPDGLVPIEECPFDGVNCIGDPYGIAVGVWLNVDGKADTPSDCDTMAKMVGRVCGLRGMVSIRGEKDDTFIVQATKCLGAINAVKKTYGSASHMFIFLSAPPNVAYLVGAATPGIPGPEYVQLDAQSQTFQHYGDRPLFKQR